MAKTITFDDLLPPTNLSATTVSGGSLENGETYFYVVQACFDGGNAIHTTNGRSQSSNEISITISDETNKSVQLTWEASTGAGGYRIYRATESGQYLQMINVTVRSSLHCNNGICTITDTGLGVPGNTNYQNNVHGRIVLSGSSSGDRFSIVDLYDASEQNGWNVVERLDNDTYLVNTFIAGDTNGWCRDTDKVIIFRDYLSPGINSTFVFGEKIGNSTRRGCRLIFKTPDLNTSFFYNLYAYKTTFDYVYINPLAFIDHISPQFIRYNSGDVEYCLINKLRGFQPNSKENCTMSDTTVTEADVALGTGLGTFSNVTGMKNNRVFQTTNNTVIVAEGVKFIDNRGSLLIGTNFEVTYINSINGSISDSQFPNTQGFSRDVFTYDLNVMDRDGNPIDGAQVTLKDNSGNTIFNVTTDSNGDIVTQQVPLLVNTVVAGVLTRNNLSPFELTIFKEGYNQYKEITEYTLSKELLKTVTLTDEGTLIEIVI